MSRTTPLFAALLALAPAVSACRGEAVGPPEGEAVCRETAVAALPAGAAPLLEDVLRTAPSPAQAQQVDAILSQPPVARVHLGRLADGGGRAYRRRCGRSARS